MQKPYVAIYVEKVKIFSCHLVSYKQQPTYFFQIIRKKSDLPDSATVPYQLSASSQIFAFRSICVWIPPVVWWRFSLRLKRFDASLGSCLSHPCRFAVTSTGRSFECRRPEVSKMKKQASQLGFFIYACESNTQHLYYHTKTEYPYGYCSRVFRQAGPP